MADGQGSCAIDGGEPGAGRDASPAIGADCSTPVRFAFLDALARRAAGQPEPVRRLLAARIARETEAMGNCQPPTAPTAPPASAISPLAELLGYLAQKAAVSTGARPPITAAGPAARAEARTEPGPELKSIAYFRDTWTRLSTEQQLAQTLAQAPANAGPMNSQHLVLRALRLMRDRSPDYLQGFMSYVDTLIWLDYATGARPPAERPPAKEGEKKAATKRRSG